MSDVLWLDLGQDCRALDFLNNFRLNLLYVFLLTCRRWILKPLQFVNELFFLFFKHLLFLLFPFHHSVQTLF